MGRPRPRRGERRIDAAIDHLAQYGFPRPQIRKIINNLLQKQEEAADKATPENDIEVSRAVHSEAPTESQSALEQQASPNSLPPQEHVLPLPPATRAAPARLPCYGWISEESETESELEDGEMLSDVPRPASIPQKDVPNPAETLPSKRKWPTRWDMRPNWG
ncbi:hypothetical protein GQ55_2G185500 [Panicum hallii var. hallii]|uniref:WIYLD domain-containing protein n=1 Tax=Panicum hallii var. hallii TaxID=1504633 RepID=A0A2T7EQA8_9POAL|nr:hypothetical protein GQ55_2G185500 [Panicum hallii var. hallii]